MKFVICFCLLFIYVNEAVGLGEIVFAVNCGGNSFTDSNGIRYKQDYLSEGTESDYGKNVALKRIWDGDRPLYETERYHLDNFGYNIQMSGVDADYVLWLKFSEVWFNGAGLKVFDVALNDNIIIKDLDIFAKVGRGVAHDEVVPFKIRNKKIIINGKSSSFDNELRVEFLKGSSDNPKINAVIVMRGNPEQVPSLPEYKKTLSEDDFEEAAINDDDEEEENEEEEEHQETLRQKMKRNMNKADLSEEPRKPKTSFTESDEVIADPYASDDTYLIPILVAIGAFIPLLFCLCKL